MDPLVPYPNYPILEISELKRYPKCPGVIIFIHLNFLTFWELFFMDFILNWVEHLMY